MRNKTSQVQKTHFPENMKNYIPFLEKDLPIWKIYEQEFKYY